MDKKTQQDEKILKDLKDKNDTASAEKSAEADMEKGQHLIACRNCSEVIWVGYEVQEDVQDDR